jgi:hypothetical protein
MTDHDDHGEADEGRTTAPQSDYTSRDIAIGAVIALVGLLVVFGIPFLLA